MLCSILHKPGLESTSSLQGSRVPRNLMLPHRTSSPCIKMHCSHDDVMTCASYREEQHLHQFLHQFLHQLLARQPGSSITQLSVPSLIALPPDLPTVSSRSVVQMPRRSVAPAGTTAGKASRQRWTGGTPPRPSRRREQAVGTDPNPRSRVGTSSAGSSCRQGHRLKCQPALPDGATLHGRVGGGGRVCSPETWLLADGRQAARRRGHRGGVSRV